jgi:hypothetical protein
MAKFNKNQIEKLSLVKKIELNNQDLKYMTTIVDKAMSDSYASIRRIGQRKAKEILVRILSNYEEINSELLEGVIKDEQ